jgi:hypothetical protein
LAVDPGTDASIGLTLTDDPARAYRAQIFLNGWNMGQYINDVGPQHTFVLPNGVLDTRGPNTLALAILADGTTRSGPGAVELTLLGRAAGGVPVTLVHSPGFPSRSLQGQVVDEGCPGVGRPSCVQPSGVRPSLGVPLSSASGVPLSSAS